MKLTKRKVAGVAIVDVDGNLVGGPDNSAKFHSLFRSLVDEGNRQVAINLQKAPWATSRGLGMLVDARRSLEDKGGELVLTQAQSRIHNLLVVTRLCLVFPTFETIDATIAYFRGKPTALSA